MYLTNKIDGKEINGKIFLQFDLEKNFVRKIFWGSS
jgi:hypothetical protein